MRHSFISIFVATPITLLMGLLIGSDNASADPVILPSLFESLFSYLVVNYPINLFLLSVSLYFFLRVNSANNKSIISRMPFSTLVFIFLILSAAFYISCVGALVDFFMVAFGNLNIYGYQEMTIFGIAIFIVFVSVLLISQMILRSTMFSLLAASVIAVVNVLSWHLVSYLSIISWLFPIFLILIFLAMEIIIIWLLIKWRQQNISRSSIDGITAGLLEKSDRKKILPNLLAIFCIILVMIIIPT